MDEGSVSAYLRFLENYPNSSKASIARVHIKDLTLWELIERERNDSRKIKFMERYLVDYYELKRVEVDSMLGNLLCLKGKYKDYLKRFPNGECAETARQAIQNKRNIINWVYQIVSDAKIPERILGQTKEKANTTTIKNLGRGPYNGCFLIFNERGAPAYSEVEDGKDSRWTIEKAGENQFRIRNEGNGHTNGHYLRLHKDGQLIASQDKKFSGCLWKFSKIKDNQYRILNLGKSKYRGYALRINREGKLMASKETRYSGCWWEVNF